MDVSLILLASWNSILNVVLLSFALVNNLSSEDENIFCACPTGVCINKDWNEFLDWVNKAVLFDHFIKLYSKLVFQVLADYS